MMDCCCYLELHRDAVMFGAHATPAKSTAGRQHKSLFARILLPQFVILLLAALLLLHCCTKVTIESVCHLVAPSGNQVNIRAHLRERTCLASQSSVNSVNKSGYLSGRLSPRAIEGIPSDMLRIQRRIRGIFVLVSNQRVC